MKIAIFRKVMGPTWNLDMIVQEKDFSPDGIYVREYTQITDWVEVEFQPLSDEQVVTGQLKQLDTVERELRNQFADKLAAVAEARAKLQSIAHERQS